MSKINKILNTIDFIEYISKPMDKKDILLIFKINKVSTEKSELMLDFIETLYGKVVNTYMGDILMTDNTQTEHFNWCWESTLNDFKKELIFFNNKGTLYEYFSVFISEVFYKETDKSEKNLENTLFFIINCFNYKKIKTKSELDNFLELYKIFNKSFNVGV
jgi:hypothetical protein